MSIRRIRRSLLITPGNRPERLARAAASAADGLVFDMEDGVAPADKTRARAEIAKALATLDFGRRERIVRINAMTSAESAADLAALDWSRIDALFVPKVEAPDELRRLAERIAAEERRLARPRHIEIIATIETPRGLFRALEITDATDRTSALFFGSGDYTTATGSEVTERARAVPRALIVAAAAAARIEAIDAAYFTSVRDVAATRADAAIARELGFAGKLVFHPDQIAVANEVFSPTRQEVERARRIVAGYAEAKAKGHGTAVVEGEFIAIDIALMAERVLARAAALGLA